MAEIKRGKYAQVMRQVYTSLPEDVIKDVEKMAEKEFLKPADIWRRFIMSAYAQSQRSKK